MTPTLLPNPNLHIDSLAFAILPVPLPLTSPRHSLPIPHRSLNPRLPPHSFPPQHPPQHIRTPHQSPIIIIQQHPLSRISRILILLQSKHSLYTLPSLNPHRLRKRYRLSLDLLPDLLADDSAYFVIAHRWRCGDELVCCPKMFLTLF